MDYRAFEQRLLETIFTTDVPLTPASIAFLYKLSVQEASDLLQQAAVAGLLNIESDDEGNLLYTYPNRTRLRRDGAQPPRDEGLPLARVEPGAISPLQASFATIDPPAASRPLTGEASQVVPAGPQRTACPFCGEVVLLTAKKCPHCHEYLDYALRDIQALRNPLVHVPPSPQPQAIVPWNGLQPALLSFFMPGLGQICTGRVPSGLLWMMFTIIGYIPLVIPGIILHILCIINATKQPRQGTL